MRTVSASIFGALLLLGACASRPTMVWERVDGSPKRDPAELHKAVTECRGDAAQAAAASPAPAIPSTYAIVAARNQREETLDAVMQGCMSKRGWALVPARS
jgi:hypothetical protein